MFLMNVPKMLKTDYVNKAVHLAGDFALLKELRSYLRPLILQSKLADAKSFTLDLEKTYREIWQSWCIDKTSNK